MSQGIMLTSIKEVSSQSSRSLSFFGKVPVQDLALMTRQLATLVRAKIPLVECLATLGDQTENAHLRIILSEVKQKINEGSALGQALADYPRVFDSIYMNMVNAGEASGTLEIVLLRLAEFTEAQVKLKNKVKGAMTYPAITLIIAVLVVAVILVFVIPE